jgi:hypothetical protein
MARVNNALVTFDDLALMGLTGKGIIPTGLGIANKAEIIAAYYVDEAASPFSTYTLDRCPPYQTIQNTTSTTTTLPPCTIREYYISGSGNFYWKDCEGVDRYDYFSAGTYICICNNANVPVSFDGGTGYLTGGGCTCTTDAILVNQGYTTCSGGTVYFVFRDENGVSSTYLNYFVNNSNVGTFAPAEGNAVQNWVNNGTYGCYGTCNKYNIEVQNNPCATQYNETRQGSLVESNSTFCGGCCGQSTAADWTILFNSFSCSGCNKYYNEVDLNPCSPTYNVVRRSGVIAESNSTFCGGCCGQSTAANWVVVEGEYVCVGFDLHYKEIDTNSCSSTYNQTRAGAVYEYNSVSCGYTPPSPCPAPRSYYISTGGNFYWRDCNGIDRLNYHADDTYICICNNTELPVSYDGGSGYLVGGGCVCPPSIQYLFTVSVGSYGCGSDLGSVAVYGYPGTPNYLTTGYSYYLSNGNYLNYNGTNSYPYFSDSASYTIDPNNGTVWNGGGSCVFD